MTVDTESILGESDWEEQDLLTIDEAGGRLEAEIATLDEQIAASADEGAAEALVARRNAIEAVRVSIAAGPTDLARAD
ncbi:hypothetical protein [Gordonia sp. NPDC058843]|uniref:hypothetical protein n=1 Tax=Gordonia sp. NPDC058843 TaxID=3346648 RepID=UPI0036BA9BB0